MANKKKKKNSLVLFIIIIMNVLLRTSFVNNSISRVYGRFSFYVRNAIIVRICMFLHMIIECMQSHKSKKYGRFDQHTDHRKKS